MLPWANDLDLVGATQSYLACLTAGTLPDHDARLAWEKFYRTFAPVVDQVARPRDRTAGTDSDGSQDIWVAVFERLASFRINAGLGSFSGWLQTIARRRRADARRGLASRPIPATWDEPPVHLAATTLDPAMAAERAEELGHLKDLLERLRGEVSPLNYRVLHLRSIEELSPGEVARLVDLTAEQVRVRHHRMLQRLRRLAVGADPKKPKKSFDRRATPSLLVTC